MTFPPRQGLMGSTFNIAHLSKKWHANYSIPCCVLRNTKREQYVWFLSLHSEHIILLQRVIKL
jgi:hypothetical protein